MASKTLELESLRKFIFSISCSFLRKVTTTIENRVQTVEPYTVIINEIRFLGILEKIYISNIIFKKSDNSNNKQNISTNRGALHRYFSRNPISWESLKIFPFSLK